MAGGPSGLKVGKGNGRGFWVGSNCLNWHAHGEEKGRGEGGGEADSAACGGGRRTRGRRKEGGGKGADRWGPPVGAAAKKKRERGGAVGRQGSWVGPPGLNRAGRAFGFFFFFFQTSFSNPFSTQIQIKLLQTFLKYFIDFLETTQATKNHASQLMMHKHLLFLSLLYYL
jgi:hypothetical protein